MSSISRLSVLAFASAALAGSPAPAYGYDSPVPYPYPSANSTGNWGSTGLGTGSPTPYTSSLETPSHSAAPLPPSYSSGLETPSHSAAPLPSSTPSSPVAPSYSQGGHGTLTSTLYSTVTQSPSYASSSGTSVGAVGYGSSSGAEVCAQEVTVTTTEKVYVTVPAGQSPSSPVSPPSSYASPPASSPSSPAAPAYSAPSSSTPAAPVTPSSTPAYSASSASSLLTLSASTPAVKNVIPTLTPSAPSTPSGGKRGLAYNSADLTNCFEGAEQISWAYNWVSASAGLTGNFTFIPTLHDGSDTFVNVWDDEASASISSGSTTLFSFNEPDQPSQANMSPEVAADLYKKKMNPFAGKAKLCAPSVTNGQEDTMGLNWLQSFITACNGECHIDCYNIHWYDIADAEKFKGHVTDAMNLVGEDKPIWVTEIGCNGASDDEISGFLQDVMPWMDGQDQVAGYAYYMVAEGNLVNGNTPSKVGNTYMSYSG